jgi:hypothetical protein
MKTTMRYVHPSDADMDEAITKARDQAYFQPYSDDDLSDASRQSTDNQLKAKDLSGATRRDRTGDLLITN